MKVTDYSFGKLEIDGKAYTADVIIAPEKITSPWWRKEGHKLQREDLKAIIEAKPDILVIGTGYFGRMAIPEETRQYLEKNGIAVREAKTAQAVAEFNELQQKSARIAAALHLTC